MKNLVNNGQLPEVPVSVEVSTKTWVQISAVSITLICVVIIGVILVKQT